MGGETAERLEEPTTLRPAFDTVVTRNWFQKFKRSSAWNFYYEQGHHREPSSDLTNAMMVLFFGEYKDEYARYQDDKDKKRGHDDRQDEKDCLLYTSPSPRDRTRSRMPSSA